MLKRLFIDEEGQGISEYTMIVAVISVAIITVMILFKEQLVNSLEKSADDFKQT